MIKKFLFFLALAATLTALPFLPTGTEAYQSLTQENTGNVLPELKGKTLAGTDITLPVKNGKATVLGVAFSPKAEQDLKGWMQPLYDTFLAKHEGVFEAGNFDGNVYLVALLSGAASLAGKGLADKAAKGTDAELRPRIILSTQDPALLAKALNVTDKNRPYFAVLDAEGHIKGIVSGPYNEAKMDEISNKASEAE
jgi:hypothetical protein